MNNLKYYINNNSIKNDLTFNLKNIKYIDKDIYYLYI